MKLSRLELIVTLALGLLATPLAVGAQQPGKVARIGYLGYQSSHEPRRGETLGHFRQGLRELGWIEGQNLVIEHRFAEGRPQRFPDLAGELVRLQVDVIVTSGESAILAAKRATTTIPIVMAATADPVASGFVASLSRPGGNITGLSILAAELGGKRLQLLKEAVPKASRVAVLWNAAYHAKAVELKNTEIAAQSLGVTIQPAGVRGPGDFDPAFAAIINSRPDALIALADPLTLNYQRRIVDFATKNRLPLIAANREFATAGGLMTYGASLPDLFRRAAYYVDRILKGAKPADLPVEQPTKFEFVINMKTAKALGLTIPPSLLLRADHVIE